jgi:hypothetical protein
MVRVVRVLALLTIALFLVGGLASPVSGLLPGGATPLTITTTTLPDGTAGVAYSGFLTASGGRTPYTWSVTQGLLPIGLSLNPTTGEISGTPIADGTYNLLIHVVDGLLGVQKQPLSLTISATPASPPPPVPGALSTAAGTAYIAGETPNQAIDNVYSSNAGQVSQAFDDGPANCNTPDIMGPPETLVDRTVSACDERVDARCPGTPNASDPDVVLNGNAAVLASTYRLYGTGTVDDPAVLKFGCFAGTVEIDNENLIIVIRDSTFWGSPRTALNLHDDAGKITIRNFYLGDNIQLLNENHATVQLEQSPGAELTIGGIIGSVTNGNLTIQDVGWWGIQGGLTASGSIVQVVASDLEADANVCNGLPSLAEPGIPPGYDGPGSGIFVSFHDTPAIPWTAVHQVVDAARETVGGHDVAWNRINDTLADSEAGYHGALLSPIVHRAISRNLTYDSEPHVVMFDATNTNLTVIASYIAGNKIATSTVGGSLDLLANTFHCGMWGVQADGTQVLSVLTRFNETALPYKLTNINDALPPPLFNDPIPQSLHGCDDHIGIITTEVQLDQVVTCSASANLPGLPPSVPEECNDACHPTITPAYISAVVNWTYTLVPTVHFGIGAFSHLANYTCWWSISPSDAGNFVPPSTLPCQNAATFVGDRVNTTYKITMYVVNVTLGLPDVPIGVAQSIIKMTGAPSPNDLLSPWSWTTKFGLGLDSGIMHVNVSAPTALKSTPLGVESQSNWAQTPPKVAFLSLCDQFEAATPPVIISQMNVSFVAPYFQGGVPLHGADLMTIGSILSPSVPAIFLPDNISLVGAHGGDGKNAPCLPGPIFLPPAVVPPLVWTLTNEDGAPRCYPVITPCEHIQGVVGVPLLDPDPTHFQLVHFLVGSPRPTDVSSPMDVSSSTIGSLNLYDISIVGCGDGFILGNLTYFFDESCHRASQQTTILPVAVPPVVAASGLPFEVKVDCATLAGNLSHAAFLFQRGSTSCADTVRLSTNHHLKQEGTEISVSTESTPKQAAIIATSTYVSFDLSDETSLVSLEFKNRTEVDHIAVHGNAFKSVSEGRHDFTFASTTTPTKGCQDCVEHNHTSMTYSPMMLAGCGQNLCVSAGHAALVHVDRTVFGKNQSLSMDIKDVDGFKGLQIEKIDPQGTAKQTTAEEDQFHFSSTDDDRYSVVLSGDGGKRLEIGIASNATTKQGNWDFHASEQSVTNGGVTLYNSSASFDATAGFAPFFSLIDSQQGKPLIIAFANGTSFSVASKTVKYHVAENANLTLSGPIKFSFVAPDEGGTLRGLARFNIDQDGKRVIELSGVNQVDFSQTAQDSNLKHLNMDVDGTFRFGPANDANVNGEKKIWATPAPTFDANGNVVECDGPLYTVNQEPNDWRVAVPAQVRVVEGGSNEQHAVSIIGTSVSGLTVQTEKMTRTAGDPTPNCQ